MNRQQITHQVPLKPVRTSVDAPVLSTNTEDNTLHVRP